jgi:hypothetical protein
MPPHAGDDRRRDRDAGRLGVAPGYDHGPVSGDSFTARRALLALAGFWTIGVAMLVASRYGSVGLDQFRQAPTCSPSQVFTPAYCRITVDATLTALTSGQAAMDIGRRHVSVEVKLHGPIPDNLAGLPVRATFYRGAVVHIQGGDLNFDTDAAPVDRVDDLRFVGLFFLIGGTFLTGAGALIRSGRPAAAR